MDNYVSLVRGQGPRNFDTQNDCSYDASPFSSNSNIVTTGAVGSDSPNWNYGQASSPAGCELLDRKRLLKQLERRCDLVGERNRNPELQRLRVPDAGAHPVRRVQRGRGQLEGLRPGPGRCAAHRLLVLRQ